MSLFRKQTGNMATLQMLATNQIYQYYYWFFMTRAASVFGYKNAPKDCDMLFFETKMVERGTAALMEAEDIPGKVFSLPYNLYNGFRDFYGYPSTRIVGNTANQYKTQIYSSNFVVLYDNIMRTPIQPYISMFALLCWELHNTFRSNLMHQNKPFIIPTTPATRLSTDNIWNQFRNFAPYINVNLSKGKQPEDFQKIFQTIDLKTEFKGKDLLECLQTTLDMFDGMVGITASDGKRERMISSEVAMNRMGDAITLNTRYAPRVEFVKKCNERGFHSEDGDMEVFVRNDPLPDIQPYGQNDYFDGMKNNGDEYEKEGSGDVD